MVLNLAFVTFVDLTGESGQNLYSRAIAKSLAEHNEVSVHLVCPEPTQTLPDELKNGISSVSYLKQKQTRSIKWQFQVQPNIWKIIHDLDTKNIDGIVSPLKPTSIILPLVSVKLSLPMVLLVEGMLSKNLDKMLHIPGSKAAGDIIAMMNSARSIHTFTAYADVRYWIQSLPFVRKEDISVFNHGVDTTLFKPTNKITARKNLDIDLSSAFVIGYVGSFKEYHCLDLLLNTTNHLLNQGMDLKLLLIGDGPEFDHIHDRCVELGIENQVILPGFVEQQTVPMYVSACDVTWGVVDPKHWGSPMKVFEYLACARPVIAYESSELEFIRNYKLGYLLSDISTDEAVDKISTLYKLNKNSLFEMGTQGREYIEANHNWNTLADQIVQEFREELSTN